MAAPDNPVNLDQKLALSLAFCDTCPCVPSRWRPMTPLGLVVGHLVYGVVLALVLSWLVSGDRPCMITDSWNKLHRNTLGWMIGNNSCGFWMAQSCLGVRHLLQRLSRGHSRPAHSRDMWTPSLSSS